MKKHYYLKATGSVCYNRLGVTFPEAKSIPIDDIAQIFFGRNFGWQKQFSWETQPEVLVFKTTRERARIFQTVMNNFYVGFVVSERIW